MESTFLPADAAALFTGIEVPFWIAGGWAIDLWLGRETRPHVDLDLAILRRDQMTFRGLGGWDMHLATAANVLEPLGDSPVAPPLHAIWCRTHPDAEWAFELLLNDDEGASWLFRRDHAIRLPIDDLGVRRDGIPVLRPEIVLLFKAKNARPHDEEDLAASLPVLDERARRWLRAAITRVHGQEHSWIDRLGQGLERP